MKVKDWYGPKDQMCNLGRLSWSVPRLFELARELPVMDVPLNHLSLYYTYEKLTLREMVTAAMSVNLSLVTVAQGEIVKKLAGWAGLLALPTLIASWYGMNFEHMPELPGRYSYWILIGIVMVACVLLYRYLRKARWL